MQHVLVSTRDLEMPGGPPGRYLDVVCLEPQGHEAFDLIGAEIAGRLVGGQEGPVEAVGQVLARWRRFWGPLPSQLLSREAQLGLLAELWFLRLWLIPVAGIREAVRRWRGPFGARHDFEWGGGSVEVKATAGVRSRTHRIHGMDQLVPPEDGRLHLFSLWLREEAGAEHSLASVVSDCIEAVRTDGGALEALEDALVQSGYSPAHEEEYAGRHYRIEDQSLYHVDVGFPCLRPDLLPAGLPAGVEYVEYDLNMAACDRWLVASDPGDRKVSQTWWS